MAPHVIEKADPEGERSGVLLGEYLLAGGSPRGTPVERWAVSLTGAAATAPMTPSEQPQGLLARHAVCSATRGDEDLSPNRKSRLKERLKQARREANAQAKERRKSDPKEIARKSKLKADRQEANRLAKEQRKAQAQSTMKLRAGIASANALGQPRSSDDP